MLSLKNLRVQSARPEMVAENVLFDIQVGPMRLIFIAMLDVRHCASGCQEAGRETRGLSTKLENNGYNRRPRRSTRIPSFGSEDHQTTVGFPMMLSKGTEPHIRLS